MNHKKLLFVFVIILLVSQFLFSNENNTLKIKDLSIQVMPEYDFPQQWPEDVPALLVGYYGTFVNNTGSEFTGNMEMDIPLDHPDFKINMICDTEKGMICLPYKLNRENNTISWKLSRPLKPGEEMPFMLEYYSSPFRISDSKSFELSPVFTSDINNVTVDIAQPARSSDFQISPIPQDRKIKNGFNHSFLYYSDLKAGSPIDMAISYIKQDNKSSVSETAPINSNNFQPPNAKSAISNSTFFIVVIFLIAIVFLGVMMYLSSRNRRTSPRRNINKKNSSGKTSRSVQSEKNKIRRLLIDGKISEKTYKQLLKEIPGNRS